MSFLNLVDIFFSFGYYIFMCLCDILSVNDLVFLANDGWDWTKVGKWFGGILLGALGIRFIARHIYSPHPKDPNKDKKKEERELEKRRKSQREISTKARIDWQNMPYMDRVVLLAKHKTIFAEEKRSTVGLYPSFNTLNPKERWCDLYQEVMFQKEKRDHYLQLAQNSKMQKLIDFYEKKAVEHEIIIQEVEASAQDIIDRGHFSKAELLLVYRQKILELGHEEGIKEVDNFTGVL